MKMNWSVLLGVFVVLAGVSILLQAVFHIHIPVVRTGIALLLIFLGVRMLLHTWRPSAVQPSGENEAVLRESLFRPEATNGGSLKYDVVLSKAVVDLTRLPPLERDLTVEINTVFGATVVKVDPAFRYEVDGSAVFGAVQLPAGQQATFGKVNQDLPAHRMDGPRLRIKISAAFGTCSLEESPARADAPGAARSALPAGHAAG